MSGTATEAASDRSSCQRLCVERDCGVIPKVAPSMTESHGINCIATIRPATSYATGKGLII